MAILILIAYHFLFFWQAYSNPFTLARSELLSTFFPSWINQGRGEKYDPYYWLVPSAHPVLAAYYPFKFSRLVTISRCRIDTAFKTYLWNTFLHVLVGSIGWFWLISTWTMPCIALFGAITLTYSGYNIKQQPCIAYTLAWFPWMLYGIATNNLLVASLSLGLTLLAGYYPIGLQTVLIAIGAAIVWGAHPSTFWFVPIGFLIGSVQLVPFLRYLPKTIRSNKHDDIGKVPWWNFLTLLLPTSFRSYVNGVGFWEMSYYVGITPLVIIASSSVASLTSRVWMLGVVSICLASGMFSKLLPRIPARWLFSFQFSLGWMATASLSNLCLTNSTLLLLCLIQAADLILNNSTLLPTRPYSELPQKPSWAFNTPLTRYLEENLGQNRVSGLPYPIFTGHINRLRTLGYSGGMQLKLMAKYRGDTNPNGSGEHDWFKSHPDGKPLDIARVEYAYTRKDLNWLTTGVPNLWRNPRLSTTPSQR